MTSNQSPTKTPLFLFAWRKAICEQGPTGAVTRAVLQALSAYMNDMAKMRSRASQPSRATRD